MTTPFSRDSNGEQELVVSLVQHQRARELGIVGWGR
jgi:hypothetical protein